MITAKLTDYRHKHRNNNMKKGLETRVQVYVNRLIRERTISEQPRIWGRQHFICCSCGKKKPTTQLQAGHYYPISHSSILRFHPINIHGECVGCNGFGKHYHLIGYSKFMRQRYGDRGLEELESLNSLRGNEYNKAVKPYLKEMLDWGLGEIYQKVFQVYHQAHRQANRQAHRYRRHKRLNPYGYLK